MYSIVSYTAPGGLATFGVTFPYLNKSHVRAFVNDVEDTTFTWPTASTITLSATPPAGAVVVFSRTTPREPLVEFRDGSILTQEDLSTSAEQALYVSQEISDEAESTFTLGTSGAYSAGGHRIENVGPPVADDDAVRKADLNAVVLGGNGVPTPAVNDAGKYLKATGVGAYDWSTQPAVELPASTPVAGACLKTDGTTVSWSASPPVETSGYQSIAGEKTFTGGLNLQGNSYPVLNLRRVGAGLDVANISFLGRNLVDEEVEAGRVYSVFGDRTDGSEDAELRFRTLVAGGSVVEMIVGAGVSVGAANSPTGEGSVNASEYRKSGVRYPYAPQAVSLSGHQSVELLPALETLPSWATEVHIILDAVDYATDGDDYHGLQVKVGGVWLTSYWSRMQQRENDSGTTVTGMLAFKGLPGSGSPVSGHAFLTRMSATQYVFNSTGLSETDSYGSWSTGRVTVAGDIEGLRLVTNRGDLNFSAGTARVIVT